ncbi:MAG: adenine deaminase [Nitrospirae bacterium]|nr:MAG: adenine deaminase [Nitrospirota bacterium]
MNHVRTDIPPSRGRAYGKAVLSQRDLRAVLRVAQGKEPADLVIKSTRWLDVFSGEFVTGDLAIFKGWIVGTQDPYDGHITIDGRAHVVVPGFIDAHVHLESSLLTPRRFQQAVLPHGTTTVIWDPHEIANVRGREGLTWALRASDGLLLDVLVMVSSCVPSTSPGLQLETSGAVLQTQDLVSFQSHPRVLGLAEMMNYPGLLNGDEDVLDKLTAFRGMRRDGHCPGLTGHALNAYSAAGIHSCHESTTLAEAREKLRKGLHVLIREGSCAKDAKALLPILNDYTSAVVGFCSDDRHAADIQEEGHISAIVDKALRAGHAPANVFRAASFAAARAYGLDDRGAIAPGFLADLCLVRPKDGRTWTSGLQIDSVLKHGQHVTPQRLTDTAHESCERTLVGVSPLNMKCKPCSADDFRLSSPDRGDHRRVRVIGVRPRQLLTDSLIETLPVRHGGIQAVPSRDILKIAVFERHHFSGRRTIGFVKGLGLRRGAIATSIGHDAHNALIVGTDDYVMAAALNRLIAIDGGIVVALDTETMECLPLPIGGLMCDEDPRAVVARLHRLKRAARELGCTLEEPFLQLSFLALPVIPSLKITDRGIIDVEASRVVSPFV